MGCMFAAAPAVGVVSKLVCQAGNIATARAVTPRRLCSTNSLWGAATSARPAWSALTTKLRDRRRAPTHNTSPVGARGPGDSVHLGDDALRHSMTLLAPSEEATSVVAEILALNNTPGDCFCLFGEVGAGKSTFSRAFIRASADDQDLVVPSPTFLLQNIYNEHEGVPVHHFDLYRLKGPPDLCRLSFDQSLTQAVSLIEWSERLQLDWGSLAIQDQKPAARMDVQILVADAAQLPAHLLGSLCTHEQQPHLEDEDDPYTDRKLRVLTLIALGKRMTQKLLGLHRAIGVLGNDLEGLTLISYENDIENAL